MIRRESLDEPRPDPVAAPATQRAAAEPATAGGLPGGARREEVVIEGATFEIALVAGADAAAVEADAVAWVAGVGAAEPPVVVPLYGTGVVWSPGRAAIVAEAAQIEPLRATVLDFTRCDATLRRLEREAGLLLDTVGDDAPCALEFDERHAHREPLLAERFLRTVAIRTELARIAPAVARPLQHPPTLAGQLGERLRERCRLAERLELLQARCEVLERVYDLCAQRIGDLATARRHLRLEWVIIVLLAAELVVLLVEVLASLGPATAS